LGNNLGTLDLDENLQGAAAGVPGLLDRQAGTVHALGNLPWRDKPIAHDIGGLIGGRPVIIENDSRLAGLSEAQLIKDTYRDRVLFATISTGIGGALIHDGRIVTALQDMEMGKMPLEHDGRIVAWEDFAGGRGVVARFGKKASEITDPSEWRAVGEQIAYGLGAVCSVLQPEVIILGGGVGAYADHFSAVILEYLQMHLAADVRQPKAVLAAQRSDDAVIYGCYELLRQGHGSADR
ncbi:MAG TPA: ROK family protein, partial [Candidatus Saccharimonadales bacterium]|nr:ROK family protein [Candidatus Saccharimonadales bacterium]